ncbi:MAG: TraR/DksA C4-type zinc finger protein [Candidatus Marinimicrobia bacterium]|nr:TraR/DksA C4-type zinc finger protein [bacterium]MCG2714910.1 TraR/DksA C4-type zinc finger protein [Candidatus Neomarinimicrobiota bacterium]
MEAKTSKKKWSLEDLEYFKNLILKQREESLKEIKRLESIARNDDDLQNNTMLDSTYAYHMADVGTDSQEREKAFLWLSRENKYLSYMNTALDRIKNSEYGMCIECGKLIPKERLEEVPHTQHCVKCKNREKK